MNKLYPPVIGGVEHVVRQLAEGFAKRGHDARVLVATERGRGGVETRDDVRVRRVSSLGTVLSTPLAPTFPIQLARDASYADIVHYHLPNPIGVVSHLLVRPDAPTVVTYHSDIVRQSRALKVYQPLLERMLADVDRIVTTSPRLRDSSPFLAPHTDKTTIVPLGIDLDAVNTDGSDADVEADTNLQPRTDHPVVLTVGRLNYYKGIEYFVRAAAEVDAEATFLVVGDGPRRDALESLARSLGVDDCVTFTGWVDDKTLATCYSAADIFVFPSVERSEAFGIVQLEAMARSLPIVNTALPTGVPWVSEHGETGLTVPPRDESALADAIERLLSDDDLRAAFGAQARERVSETFTESQMVEETLTVYRTLTIG
ncbi:glycosyltransferase [Haloarcula litorea]|uniref:glycosyltransferase n=1 Tax=Haloarcula litorea TaxID=3032579 RepID=UPI0023E7C0B8|nr:glycosyltransferase [Halomicroarcula sp. GDY20]